MEAWIINGAGPRAPFPYALLYSWEICPCHTSYYESLLCFVLHTWIYWFSSHHKLQKVGEVKKGTCTSIRGTNLAPLHLRVGVAVCFYLLFEAWVRGTGEVLEPDSASVSCALPSRWRARGPAHHTTCWEPATGPPVLINQAVALKRVRGRRLDVFFSEDVVFPPSFLYCFSSSKRPSSSFPDGWPMGRSHWHARRFPPHLFSLFVRAPRPQLPLPFLTSTLLLYLQAKY